MYLPIEHLEKLEKVLVPFRSNSAGIKTSSELGARLLKFSDSTSDCQPTYSFFADILFLKSEEGLDQRGAERAFDGLFDVLEAALDVANLQFEIRENLLTALEGFKNALAAYAGATYGAKYFAAELKKQDNIITHYLWRGRKFFWFPAHLNKLLITAEEAEEHPQIPREKLTEIYDFFSARRALRFSEPTVRELLKFIPKNDNRRSLQSPPPEFYSLLRQSIEQLETRWRKVCLAGYRITRTAVETPARTPRNVLSRSRKSARVVQVTLTFLPAESLTSSDIFTAFSARTIYRAFRLCWHSRKYVVKTFEQYHRIAYFIMRGRIYPWEERKRGIRRKILDDLIAQTGSDWLLETGGAEKLPFDTIEVENWLDENQQQITEGAAPSEFDTDVSRELAPPGSATRAAAFYPADDLPSWARSRLTAETLGVVLAWLRDRAASEPQNKFRLAVLTFVELQLLFGFSPNTLLETQIIEETFEKQIFDSATLAKDADQSIIKQSEPLLTFKNNGVQIRPVRRDQTAAFGTTVDERQIYLLSQSSFFVPLAPHINDSLQALRASLPATNASLKLFAYSDLVSGKIKVLDKSKLNAELKILGKLLSEHISVEKIANSVLTLHREFCRMDELITSLFSAEIPRRLASQTFYTNLKISEIIEPHRNAAQQLFAHFAQQSRLFLEHTDKFKVNPLNKNLINSYFVNAETKSSENVAAGIGSPFVPQRTAFSESLGELRQTAESAENWILRHNRMTAHTVLTLMALTGLRPLELINLTTQSFNYSDSFSSLVVVAKINQAHREWRHLNVPPEVTLLLARYARFAAETRHEMRILSRFTRREFNERIGDSLFFYLRQTFAPVLLTTRSLRSLLTTDYLGLPKFAWRTNSPRHFFRTEAVRLGVPRRMIDALMGHQTSGAEALGLFSAHNRSEEQFYAEKIARHVWQELNLDYVKFPPTNFIRDTEQFRGATDLDRFRLDLDRF